jgi:hypothetical protein
MRTAGGVELRKRNCSKRVPPVPTTETKPQNISRSLIFAKRLLLSFLLQSLEIRKKQEKSEGQKLVIRKEKYWKWD